MDWKSKIPGCFGDVDKIFAGHPYDEERAAELRKLFKEQDVSKQDIEEAFEDWLGQQTWNVEHSKAQLEKVRKYFGI